MTITLLCNGSCLRRQYNTNIPRAMLAPGGVGLGEAMQNLRIGQPVKVTALSCFDDVWETNNRGERKFTERQLKQPAYGVVSGKSRRPIGKLQFHGWGDSYTTFTPSGSIIVWEVKLGWLNRPVLVPDSGIKTTRKQFNLPQKTTVPR